MNINTETSSTRHTAQPRTGPSGTYALTLATACLLLLLASWSVPWAGEVITDGARQHIALLGTITLAGELGRRLWRISRVALRAKVRRFLLDEHPDHAAAPTRDSGIRPGMPA